MGAASAIGAGAILGGGLLSANATRLQGQTASRMANFQAGQMETQAAGLDQSAIEQQGEAQLKARSSRNQARMLQSKLIAAAAANGDTNSKSVVDTAMSIAGEGEYRSLTDLYNGNSNAYQLRNQAWGLRKQATMTRFEGRAARAAANIGAIGSLLGTFGQAATFSTKFNDAGGGKKDFGSGTSGGWVPPNSTSV